MPKFKDNPFGCKWSTRHILLMCSYVVSLTNSNTNSTAAYETQHKPTTNALPVTHNTIAVSLAALAMLGLMFPATSTLVD